VFIKALRDTSYTDDEVLIYDFFGKMLIQEKNMVLKEFLKKEINKFEEIDQKQDYLTIVRSALSAMR